MVWLKNSPQAFALLIHLISALLQDSFTHEWVSAFVCPERGRPQRDEAYQNIGKYRESLREQEKAQCTEAGWESVTWRRKRNIKTNYGHLSMCFGSQVANLACFGPQADTLAHVLALRRAVYEFCELQRQIIVVHYQGGKFGLCFFAPNNTFG